MLELDNELDGVLMSPEDAAELLNTDRKNPDDPNELDVAVMSSDVLHSMLLRGYTWEQIYRTMRLAGRIRPDLCQEYATNLECTKSWRVHFEPLGFRFKGNTCLGWRKP